MIVRTPSLLDHLDDVILKTARQGHGIVESITMPIWMMQVFQNEIETLIHTYQRAMIQPATIWKYATYRGVQILFHEKLTTMIKVRGQ